MGRGVVARIQTPAYQKEEKHGRKLLRITFIYTQEINEIRKVISQ